MATWTFRSGHLPEDREAAKKILDDGEHPLWLTITKQIGAVLVSTAQQAFRDKRLGEEEWPQRYPNQQGPPFVNVAGIVADLGRGQKPPKRRFEPQPVLRDTGELMGSVDDSSAVEIEPFGVSVKSDVPYASVHQHGGTSTLLVDTKVRYGLMLLLRKRKDLGKRLGWLFSTEFQDILETRVHPRPFLGVTPRAQEKILRIIDHHLEGRPWESQAPPRS